MGAPLPAQAPSGPPAVSCWEGRTIFALPYAGADLHLVVADGARGRAYSLPTQCEQVALGRPAVGGDGDPEGDPSGVIGLACLREGELYLGSIDVEAP
jgi:hypothetical protein